MRKSRLQEITDQQILAMPAKEIDDILSTMNAEEALDFLEQIGRLRAWLIYESLGADSF